VSGAHRTIRFAVRAFGPFESAVQKIWQAYCRQTGCDFQLEAVPLELHDLHQAILVREGLKNGAWDLAHLNTDWMAEARATGALADLSPFIQNNPPGNYPDGWTASLLGMQTFGEEVLALPFHDGPECLIYRKDLFNDPARQAAFRQHYGADLVPPTTWEDFQRVARFFTRPAQNLYGAVFAAYPDGHNAVFDFCLQLWSRGGELTDAAGNVDIDTPAARQGLAYYRQMLRDTAAVHPGSATFDSVKAGRAFACGEVAMMVNWFGFASYCEVAADCRVKGQVEVAPIPQGPGGQAVSLNVYWMYGIGAGSAHQELVYDFLRFAVSRQNDKLLTLEGGIGCRLSTWHDPEVNALIPYYHKLEALHRHARELPRRTDWAAIAARIDQVVLRTLATDEPVADILRAGQQSISRLINGSPAAREPAAMV
jgi:multiple sugar transport system substrate-binding protein